MGKSLVSSMWDLFRGSFIITIVVPFFTHWICYISTLLFNRLKDFSNSFDTLCSLQFYHNFVYFDLSLHNEKMGVGHECKVKNQVMQPKEFSYPKHFVIHQRYIRPERWQNFCTTRHIRFHLRTSPRLLFSNR